MVILVNFSGLQDFVRDVSHMTTASPTYISETIRKCRVFMAPSRFKTHVPKEYKESSTLCSDLRRTLLIYFGKKKLDSLRDQVGEDILKYLLKEYINILRIMNYDVGDDDCLLEHTMNEPDEPVINAGEVQVLEEKYI